MRIIMIIATTLFSLALSIQVQAQQVAPEPPVSEPSMTLTRMAQILLALDSDAQVAGTGFELTISDVPILVVVDPVHDRMRAMVPIRSATELDAEEMMRLLQADFDTALDARYAVAQGRLWSVYIHPFSPLERDQLISGIAQTVNLATTYGTLYSGGAAQFGRGDSNDLQRQLLLDLLDRGQDI